MDVRRSGPRWMAPSRPPTPRGIPRSKPSRWPSGASNSTPPWRPISAARRASPLSRAPPPRPHRRRPRSRPGRWRCRIRTRGPGRLRTPPGREPPRSRVPAGPPSGPTIARDRPPGSRPAPPATAPASPATPARPSWMATTPGWSVSSAATLSPGSGVPAAAAAQQKETMSQQAKAKRRSPERMKISLTRPRSPLGPR